MLLSIEGQEGTAKTTIAYTAPLPVVGFSFDMGWERAIYGAKHGEYFSDLKIRGIPYTDGSISEKSPWSGHDITVFELPQPVQLTKSSIRGCTELWEYFIHYFAQAAQEDIPSIVLDTATIARRVKADAYLQELQEGKGPPRKQLLQIEWGHPNGSINAIYTFMQNLRKNLITVHHLRPERVDRLMSDGTIKEGFMTGNWELEGWDKTYREVDVAVRTEKSNKKITSKFVKCGYNLNLEGDEIENPTWDKIVKYIETAGGYKRGLPKRDKK